MSNCAISVENISKRYQISSGKKRHDTFRDLLADSLSSLFRRNGKKTAGVNSFWALQDVSFKIGQGQIVGIIGHNGAGKSTMMKILSRITQPTLGRAEIYGRVGSLLEVGTGFHPELSGRENIFLNGAIIGMSKAEIRRHFDAIVDFAEVEKFIDMPVKRYSSGMYVRLAFAVAAHLEPEVLLVDEVLSVGDASFQKKCLGKIEDAAKGGRTVVFISHNMTAVSGLCERVIWLDSGRIVEDGPAADTVKKYLAKSVMSMDLCEEAWDDPGEAPGNDIVRFHKVGVRRQDGRLSDPLTMQTPFLAEIECWNLVPDTQLHITLHLYTAEGIIAFTTASLDGERLLPEGLFRCVCSFPGNLLNSGSHRFVVLVVRNSSTVIYRHESRVSFDIIDAGERQGAYFGREPGVVQPVLKWTTECLGKAPEGKALFRYDQQPFL